MHATMLLSREEPLAHGDGTLTLRRAALDITLTRRELTADNTLWIVCWIQGMGTQATHRIGLHLIDPEGSDVSPPMRDEVVSALGHDEHRLCKRIRFSGIDVGETGDVSMRVELRIDGAMAAQCQVRLEGRNEGRE